MIPRNDKRLGNKRLFEEFVIDMALAESIICSLNVYDFSKVEPDNHMGNIDEMIYFFGKDVSLLERFGTKKRLITLYIKFSLKPFGLVVVISFHEAKYPISYYFR